MIYLGFAHDGSQVVHPEFAGGASHERRLGCDALAAGEWIESGRGIARRRGVAGREHLARNETAHLDRFPAADRGQLVVGSDGGLHEVFLLLVTAVLRHFRI